MMLVYGLRLFVALITFAVGVAASSLLGSSGKSCGMRAYSYAPVHVTPPLDAPPPKRARSECFVDVPPRKVAGGLLQGKAYSKPQPVYPPAAKAAGVQGTVVVKVEVDESGRVASAEAVSGPPLLREAAEEAARAARYAPTRVSGEPVWVSGVVTYNFVLP